MDFLKGCQLRYTCAISGTYFATKDDIVASLVATEECLCSDIPTRNTRFSALR